ncbi:MAG: AAA family ATPase [Bacteroidales bacterium]|nr:AAA family ATPase [Bacteroidales bacterium]
MKLISFKLLSDFRNLKGVELKFNSQTNTYVLIGNNGAGKSSLLEAISSIFYTLFSSSRRGFEFEFSLSFINDGHNVEVSNTDTDVEEIRLDGTTVSRTVVLPYLPQRVICNYSGEETRIEQLYYLPLWKKHEDTLIATGGYNPLRMVFVNKELWKIILYIIIAFRNDYDSFNKFLNQTLGFNGIDSIVFDVDRDALDRWSDNPVTHFMHQLAKTVREDGTIDPGQMNPTGDDALTVFNSLNSARSLIKEVRIVFNGGVDSQYLSEGEKKLMVVLFMLEAISNERSLVLLDEPDSHIHVARKTELADLFKDAVNRENVITSHSPTLTDEFKDEAIIMLDRTADGHAQVIDADKKKIVSKLTDGKWSLQKQNIFLSSTDDIILVEGQTDELFLKKALSVLQSQGKFTSHRYEYLPCGGSSGVVLLKEHFHPKPGQHIFCFFDSDKAGWESINAIFETTKETLYNSSNFTGARKKGDFWVAPYPKGKKRVKEFNIEDYFGGRLLMHYVMKCRSLNTLMTKKAIKDAMEEDCRNGNIDDKYYKNFSYVFHLIEDMKAADVAGSVHL